MSKSQIIPWPKTEFLFEEWEQVEACWQELVQESKIVFGKKAPVAKNVKTLLRRMSKNDLFSDKNLHRGLPAESKKYKKLWNSINKWSKE